MEKGEYEVQVAKDGLLLSFLHTIRARLFNKKILREIMGANYRESRAHTIAWDDTALEMQEKKVCPWA